MNETVPDALPIPEAEAMAAVRELFRQPVVMTTEFHRVYGLFLDSEIADNDDVRGLFEDNLHNTGTPFDDQLLKDGKICTVDSGTRDEAPDSIPFEDDEAKAAWAAANVTLEDRLGR